MPIEVDHDRALTAENVKSLLDKLTLPEMAKRVKKCESIDALTALVNVAQGKARRAPLWGPWKCGHFTRPQLDELTELAEDRIKTLNKEHLSRVRNRDFLESLHPQTKQEENHGQARQGTLRRGRRERRRDTDDTEF